MKKINIKKAKSVLGLFLAVNMFMFNYSTNVLADEKLIKSNEIVTLPIGEANDELLDYSEYLNQYKDSKKPSEEYIIEAEKYYKTNMPAVALTSEGVTTKDSGSITYHVDIKNEGLYYLEIKFKPISGKNSTIERKILINDTVPFKEANNIVFYRVWADKDRDYKEQKGNQTYPQQEEKFLWMTQTLTDSEGFYNEPLCFYLSKGENLITLESIKEPMEIDYIKVKKAEKKPTYQEYLSKYGNIKETVDNAETIYIEAEDALLKSNACLHPINDRTSPKTSPYHPSDIVINVIGGKTWNKVGDFISWEVNTDKEGLYKICLRYKQDETTCLFSSRTLSVNGEIPFEEATDLRFFYTSKFKTEFLKNPKTNEEIYVYLNKGKNTIALEVSMGKFAGLVLEAEKCLKNLNELYRRMIAVTGVTPDKFRDYQILTKITDMTKILDAEANRLQSIIRSIKEITGEENEQTAILNKLLLTINKLSKKPDDISKLLSPFKSDLSALSKWILDIRRQPLTIDYLIITDKNIKPPKAEGNIFEKFIHEIRTFIGSFSNKFYETSNNQNSKKEIEVWVTMGRDQYDVLNRLVNESFRANENTNVKLKLVGADVLLPSTLTGKGPDVAVQVGSTLPVTFALRDAAYDLSQFSDFDEISKQFSKGALEFFEYNDGCYGLPDQMSFPVMFYRKDILSKFNIQVPETWDDLTSVIPYLQKHNMDIYLDTAPPITLGSSSQLTNIKAINPIFLSMLYQQNGKLYSDDGKSTLLGEKKSLDIFKKWTEFYTRHNFPKEADFITRFRVGETPIGVVNFTNYTRLSVSAPEIRGDWAMAPVPGTKTSSGNIRRDTPCVTSGVMMLKKNIEKRDTADEAWEFIKWWVSEETQLGFAREMEAVLGTSARYPVSNLGAFEKMPWPSDVMSVLSSNLNELKGEPQVPGSYITGRYLENAFLQVVNADENPIDTLYDFTELINEELYNKRKQLGLVK